MPDNPWIIHVQNVKKQFPDLPYRQLLIKAKASYKKK